MSKYDEIVDELQRRVDNGEITLEQANRVNDIAYDKYIMEAEAAQATNKKTAAPSAVDPNEERVNAANDLYNAAKIMKSAQYTTKPFVDALKSAEESIRTLRDGFTKKTSKNQNY